MVTTPSRVFPTDEERGKKDDDYKASSTSFLGLGITPFWRKRRLFVALIACLVLWLFVRNISTDLGGYPRRTSYRQPAYRQSQAQRHPSPNIYQPPSPFIQQAPIPKPVESPPGPEPPYEGAIKFYELGPSLKRYKSDAQPSESKKNILFAASDLSSASTLIALACQMSSWQRNTVHIAVLGKDETSIDEIRSLNDVDEDTCDIWWHDARPDRASKSSYTRMETSVAGAMRHFKAYLDPSAVITIDAQAEDTFFTAAAAKSLEQMKISHIQVPVNAIENLGWMTRLDANALQAWHAAGIDIMISAPVHASASLIRLLKSLAKADYSGFFPPRLTIELPPEVDSTTSAFLQNFQWPPATQGKYHQPDQLTFRRRVKEQKVYEDEASVRFVESFFPTSPIGPHILILTPQAELSPVYFHYLKLNLLDLKYSADALGPSQNLFGISLESPSRHLNGSAAFEPSLPRQEKEQTTERETEYEVENEEEDGEAGATRGGAHREKEQEKDFTPDPFRWQAPNSNAALYFADKWIEAHEFLTMRHSAAHHPSTRLNHRQKAKLMAKTNPGWTEYFLDLMRVRGYYLHFPGLGMGLSHDPELKSPATALAIIHNELYQAPEEFSSKGEEESGSSGDAARREEDEYLDSHSTSNRLNVENRLLQNLWTLLPRLNPRRSLDKSHGKGTADTFYGIENLDAGDSKPLTPLDSLALLDHLGEPISEDNLRERALEVSVAYRRSLGGCTEQQSTERQAQVGTVSDLFCIADVQEDGYGDDGQDLPNTEENRHAHEEPNPPNGAHHAPPSPPQLQSPSQQQEQRQQQQPQPQPQPDRAPPIGSRPGSGAAGLPEDPNRAPGAASPGNAPPRPQSDAQKAADARIGAADRKLAKAADADARASASAEREAERQIDEHPERGPDSERIKIVNLEETMKERAGNRGVNEGAATDRSIERVAPGVGGIERGVENGAPVDATAAGAARAAAEAALAPAERAQAQLEKLERLEKQEEEEQEHMKAVQGEMQAQVQAQVHDHPQAPREGQQRAMKLEGAKDDIMQRVEDMKERHEVEAEAEAEAERAAAASAA